MKPAIVRVYRGLLGLLLAAAAAFAAMSCQSVAGIEERELGPCGNFCDVVMTNCAGKNRVYDGRTKCMAVCKLLDVGDATEPQGKNTVSCRLREAELATNPLAEDYEDHCRSAGPEGLNCGGECENYCTLYERACGTTQCGSHEQCRAKCAALKHPNFYDVDLQYEGDTLQCRLVHLSNAAVSRGAHCGHGDLMVSTLHCNDQHVVVTNGEGGAGSEVEPDKYDRPARPQCADYCRVEEVACQGDYAQYESNKQCLALCAYYPPGDHADKTPDTLGSRIYHAYNSLCAPSTHCPHTGPGGEGHVGTAPGDKCVSYCRLARDICPMQYATEFTEADADAECLEECGKLQDSQIVEARTADAMYYTVKFAQTPATLACRYLALSRAAVDLTLCSNLSAFGEGDCAEP